MIIRKMTTPLHKEQVFLLEVVLIVTSIVRLSVFVLILAGFAHII